jgi:hypothetical protein
MAKVMHKVLLEATKVTLVVTSFIPVSVNEVIVIDNTQCLSIHLYVVQQWKRIPILLSMEIVNMFATSNNILVFMLKCLLKFRRLRLEEFCEKLVNIGCNGSSMFQGHKTGVTHQFEKKVVPLVIRVHYFAHKTNVVVIILADFLFVHQLEFLLQSFYAFFRHNLKKFAKFQKLVDLLQTKGNKLLGNVKTHWISMLSPAKWVNLEFFPLIVKMHVKSQ